MDAAVHAITPNYIIGVRGTRVFRCDPSTGQIIEHLDCGQVGLGFGTIVYCNATNKCYVACMVTPHYDVAAFGADRNLYRINPNPLSIDAILPFKTTFGLTLGDAALESGIMTMRTFGTSVFAMAFKSTVNPSLQFIQFDQTNPAAAPVVNSIGFFNYPSFGIGVVGGETFTFWARQDADTIASFGWGGTGFNQTAFDVSKGYYAVEYANNKVFATREFQFIDVYDNASTPNYLTTINTGRTDFNGLNIRLNLNDNHLYIAGGADNTVIVVNPADNSFVVKTGFDLPTDFCFTPSKVWAVQQGSAPLKEVV